MSIRTVTLILLAGLFLVGLLLTPACARVSRWDVSYDPKIAGDGAGGAIALYDVMKNSNQRDFRVQRVSPEGQKLWGDQGVLVGSQSKGNSVFVYTGIISDSHSGAIVFRRDTGTDPKKHVYQLTRIDPAGEILWQEPAPAIEHIAGDGEGGAIIAAVSGGSIVLHRFDAEGHRLWGEDGVAIQRPGYAMTSLQLSGDGDGAAVIAWLEEDAQRGIVVGGPVTTEIVIAQRIDSNGKLAWGQDGVRVYTAPQGAAASWLRLSGDNTEDHFLTWEQYATVTTAGDSPTTLLNDIGVQKIDSNGHALWQAGATLGISAAAGAMDTPQAPLVVSDGSGGAVITWQDTRTIPRSLYIQRVSDNGTTAWQAGGVGLFDIPSGVPYRLDTVGDGTGGAMVSLTFKSVVARNQGIRLRKVSPDGRSVWLVEPVNISVDLPLGAHYTLSDGAGGAILAWSTRRSDFSDSQTSFVQRIGQGGESMWGDNGIRLDQ
jgi:hypothetical protein